MGIVFSFPIFPVSKMSGFLRPSAASISTTPSGAIPLETIWRLALSVGANYSEYYRYGTFKRCSRLAADSMAVLRLKSLEAGQFDLGPLNLSVPIGEDPVSRFHLQLLTRNLDYVLLSRMIVEVSIFSICPSRENLSKSLSGAKLCRRVVCRYSAK